ncbi:MAG: hypothetical protein LBT25_07610 [Candidatus Symbiothrix sp.]|jgi:hypothetical protein|nr:hypothetical protein [Candidatus Symbiothrix sp.]
MDNKKKYYKESIKDRMYKHAASFWGVRNIENFDPLVKLLIEALASEVYKLANEVNNIETRILERIAHLLTPDILMTVRPAHMLLHTQPTEVKGILNKQTGFYYGDPVFKQKNKVRELGFYPVDTFQLLQSSVKTLICGRNIYTLDQMLNKELFTRSTVRSEVFSRSVWIGLQLNPKIDSIKNLSVYFDFVNAENKNKYFHLLPFVEWQHKSQMIKVTQGIHTIKDAIETGDISLFSNYDLANISDESIKKFYNHCFITLRDEIKVSNMEKECFPEELKSLFPEERIQQMQEPLYWFHLTFPPAFNDEIIDRIMASPNVFPVANKNSCSQISKELKLSNIIPLNTAEKESFLSIHSVVDTHNRQYKQLPFHDKETQHYGTYSIKRGGTERFDSRDAKEYVAYLTDLLRDEGASFSLLGKGFLEDLIDRIEDMILSVEQRLNAIDKKREIPSYLIIDSESDDELIYVDYWTTNCELANDIKAGTLFSPYTDTFVNQDLIISLTPSTGGKGLPDSTRVLDMYKYILTSRNRIYTSEDIINFCLSEFGDMIVSVDVKKGIMVSSKPKEGLIRTIDVFVSLKKLFDIGSSDELRDNIHNQLIEKSPDTYNYRIFIN